MKRLPYIVVLPVATFFALTAIVGPAFGYFPNKNLLKNVQVKSLDEGVQVDLQMNKKVDVGDVPYVIGKYSNQIVFSIENAYVDPSKRTFEIEHPKVEKVYAAQMTPDRVDVVVYLKEGAKPKKGMVSVKENDAGVQIVMGKKNEPEPEPLPDLKKALGDSLAPSVKQDAPKAPSGYAGAKKSGEDIDLSGLFPDLKKEKEDQETQAAGTADKTEAGGEKKLGSGIPSMLSASLKIGIALAVSLAVLLGGTYFLRRFGALPKVNREDYQPIRTLASRTIAPKRKVHVIAVGDEKFLIGDGPQGLTTLGKLSPKNETVKSTEAAPEEAPKEKAFGMKNDAFDSKEPTPEPLNTPKFEDYLDDSVQRIDQSEAARNASNIEAIKERLARLKRLP